MADLSVRLKTLQVKAPYRGINKLPAEPVVMIIKQEISFLIKTYGFAVPPALPQRITMKTTGGVLS